MTVRQEYYKKYNVVRRNEFDPRASVDVKEGMSKGELDDFVKDLQYAVVQDQREDPAGKIVQPQAFQFLLPDITYEDFELDEMDVATLCEQCHMLYDALRSIPTEDPYLVPNTELQVPYILKKEGERNVSFATLNIGSAN